MKELKKIRKKARKLKDKEKLERQTIASMNKSFAAALLSSSNRKHAHMEWDGSKLIPTKPEPYPRLTVNAYIIHASHKKLDVDWKGSRVGSYDPKKLDGIADTGCQTCTGGTDILRDLKCQSIYLVPT